MLLLSRNLFRSRVINNYQKRNFKDSSLEEQLLQAQNKYNRDSSREDELEQLKQRQRRLKRLSQAAKVAQLGAKAAGYGDMADYLGAAGDMAGVGAKNPGMLKNYATNKAGKAGGALARLGANEWGKNQASKAAAAGQQVGKLANAAKNMGAGSEAAVGGAIAGALKGEGAAGIAKTAAAWWVLNFAFGFLTLAGFTVIGFLCALAYLDTHYIISKITNGRGYFINLSLWQKIVLAFANLLLSLVIILPIFLFYAATCGTSLGSFGTKALSVVSFGYYQDFCSGFKFSGGMSGGGGASASFADGDVIITSAYRPNSFVDGDPNRPSAHGRGEAFDIALRNPTVGFRPSPPDPRIAEMISLARSIVGSRGDVVDEYNNPSPGTTGPHIHIELNAGQCGTAPTNPPNDLVPLPSTIPMSGVSDARVRSCMLPIINQFFASVNSNQEN